MNPRSFKRIDAPVHRFVLAGLIALWGALLPAEAVGQAPTAYHACYVPASGVVYLIQKDGLPTECSTKGKEPHIAFTWTDGARAVRSGDAAGGDLAGSYPDLVNVVGLRGRSLSGAVPGDGDVLAWDETGSAWSPRGVASAASPWAGYEIVEASSLQTILPPGEVTRLEFSASCPTGKSPIGGGYRFEGQGDHLFTIDVQANFPTITASGLLGWFTKLRVENPTPATRQIQLHVNVICVGTP